MSLAPGWRIDCEVRVGVVLGKNEGEINGFLANKWISCRDGRVQMRWWTLEKGLSFGKHVEGSSHGELSLMDWV